jgi:hypothetical protein
MTIFKEDCFASLETTGFSLPAITRIMSKMKISFLKYFFWGWVGLLFQTHCPNLPVDFYVLTLALAFPALGLGSGLILALGLAFLYGGQSLAPWWAWWISAAIAMALLRLWKALGDFSPTVRRGLILSFLLIMQWLWGAAWYGWAPSFPGHIIHQWFGTLLCGLVILPLLQRSWAGLLQRMPRPRRSMGELPLYMKATKLPRGSRELRRPFGLERG